MRYMVENKRMTALEGEVRAVSPLFRRAGASVSEGESRW